MLLFFPVHVNFNAIFTVSSVLLRQKQTFCGVMKVIKYVLLKWGHLGRREMKGKTDDISLNCDFNV